MISKKVEIFSAMEFAENNIESVINSFSALMRNSETMTEGEIKQVLSSIRKIKRGFKIIQLYCGKFEKIKEIVESSQSKLEEIKNGN